MDGGVRTALRGVKTKRKNKWTEAEKTLREGPKLDYEKDRGTATNRATDRARHLKPHFALLRRDRVMQRAVGEARS